MPAKRAFREGWSEQRLQNALLTEEAQAAITRARRAGKRLAGTLAFRYGMTEARTMVLGEESRAWLRINGVWEELWPLATRIAVARLATKETSIPHGGTVLPPQKRQYYVNS